MSEEIPEVIPHSIEPGALARARQITSDPADTPVHHTTIDADQRFESVVPATGLDPAYQWFCLGLAYCLIKIDRSLFEVFQAAGNLSIPIKTHRADRSIIDIPASNYEVNPWSAMIQGIPREHGRNFIDFIASYKFDRKDTGHQWCCNFQELRCADPLASEASRAAVNIWFALPRNMTTGRQITILRPPGLLLDRPVFGVTLDQ